MSLPPRTDTVVIGAGHAGLAMSYFLGQAGRDHVVLERRATLGGGWQDRWDEFCLVTPNWTTSFPGDPYKGPDPDGFMPRDAVVRRVAEYAATIAAPVELETTVERVTKDGERFRVETSQGAIDAARVVVAAGSFHVPRIPPAAAGLSPDIEQLHSHAYRRESALPPGGVLVVGTGQSGVQIAEELADAGREVYLSVGSAGRAPRRYRGRDLFGWIGAVGMNGAKYGVEMPTVDKLPDPRAKFAPNPHLSGHDGGHETNLREFGARGMTLLGRIEGIDGHRVQLGQDLTANLAAADRFFGVRMQPIFDAYIERAGIDAPPDDRQPFSFDPPERTELRLDEAGISTVIWTTGYRLDYSWLQLPILDEFGYPRQKRGVSEVPGLYFLGLMWQHTMGSGTLFGPNLDGRYVAAQMGLLTPEAAAAPVA
jgi:putative flavoprotein involved in K+ transport